MVRSGISSGSPDPESLPVITIFETENSAHAAELGVKSALELSENKSYNQGYRKNRLLLLAGGDGFHNNILSSIINKVPGTLKDFSIFRLPMGTGNDSADVKNTDEAFAVLSAPSGIKKDSIIRINTSCGKEYTALNIVSFGLDAYVCELTNNIKEIAGPEIIYKLSANIAILQYEKKWPLNEWEIQIYKKNENTVLTRKNRFQLVVFGRKGNTTYGGGLKVLPAEENFLLVEQLSVMQKIKIKPLFYRGDHRGLPVTEFFKTEKVVLNYHDPVLMETDGEVIYLKKEDFPLTISIISDYLQIIK
jgi:diacylglycerol kinase family enzyme